MPSNHSKIILSLVIVLTFTALISLGIGRYSLSVSQIFELIFAKLTNAPLDPIQDQVLFQVRFPRIMTAAFVGAGLALSGVTLQGIFHNPLVDPHVIGVTSGSAFGGCLAIFLGFNVVGLFFSTVIFGIATLIFVFLLSHHFIKRSLLILILMGMILSGFFSALVSLLQYIADTEEKLPSIIFWLMGSFATANMQKLTFFLIPFLLCSLILLGLRWRINLISLGSKEARALGININLLRWSVLFCSGIIVACQVAISGSIGWIGLIIPHISRMIVGSNHQIVLPCAMLIGSIYMIIIDNLARGLTNGEIPISILTSLLGAPLFAFLVYRLKKGHLHES